MVNSSRTVQSALVCVQIFFDSEITQSQYKVSLRVVSKWKMRQGYLKKIIQKKRLDWVFSWVFLYTISEKLEPVYKWTQHLRDWHFLIKTSDLSFPPCFHLVPFYLCCSKYWNDMMECLHALYKTRTVFYSHPQFTCYPVHSVPTAVQPPGPANSLARPVSSETPPPALLVPENSAEFVTFFKTFLLGQLFGKKKKIV